VLAGITVALRDVTRTRRLEGFKGDLVATTAHELRTPLTSLHMAVQLCLEEVPGPLTDHQRKMLAAAREDSERLQAVVEELLELARLESGSAPLSRTPMDVAETPWPDTEQRRAERETSSPCFRTTPRRPSSPMHRACVECSTT
jgi:signal transduction histidine kinase